MKKTFLFLFIVYFVSLLAVHNQFPIGLYSCLRSSNYTTLIEKADNANINMVGIRYNQIGAANFWDAIDLADSKQMDVRIYDDIEFADGGTYHLGGCNHFWYDAENSLSDLLSSYYNVCPDYWFYGLRALDNNTGAISSEDYASGDPLRDDYPATAHKAWHCSETAGNQPGWAVQYLAYKEEPFHSVSSQVHIPSGIDPDDLYFYFDYALKFVNTTNASDDTPVCRLEVVVRNIYDQNIYQYDSQVTLHPVAGANYDHILTVGELEANAVNQYYTMYQFYAKWDEDFPDDIMMNSDRIAYIAFRIWWYGVGDLKIDGMQMEDNLFRQLENGTYDTAISTRMNQYNGYNNINHFYSYDEPQPPQYRSFKNIQDNIQNYSLATAVMRHDQYARYKIFDYLAEPDLFMEDFYPISPGLTWNTEPESNPDEPSHVQHYLDNMTNYYRNLREYFGQNAKPWYAVVQAYGNWERGNDNEWQDRIIPPSKTLQSLAFLPLCYDTDGIVYFTYDTRYNLSRDDDDGFLFETQSFMFDEFRDSGFWDIKGLLEDTNRDNEGSFDVLTDQYYAVQQANSEIEVIASIIQNLTWLGANHDNNVIYEGSVYLSGLMSVAVTNNDNDYDGFVEIGVYENELTDEFYFMLVNRRANIIDPAYDNGLLPLPEDVDSKFTDAFPQDLILSFENLENDFVLVDQYTGDIYDIDNLESEAILIEPGDGMLLKLCQLPMPQIINTTYSIGGSSVEDYIYVPYDVTVKNEGWLLSYGNVEFGPNATLTIEDGGNVVFWGENKFGENSEIIVHGELQLNPQNLYETSLTSKIDKWQGIECLEGGVVTIENNTIIEKAQIGVLCYNGSVTVDESAFKDCMVGISVLNNSIFNFTNSTIELKRDEDSRGIVILNSASEGNISICGTESEPTISGEDNLGTGIQVDYQFNDENVFSCNTVNFYNLAEGIHYITYAETDNQISNCTFDHCLTGIVIESSVENDDEITNCTFGYCATGLSLNGSGSLKRIADCYFNLNSIGIQQNTFQVPISYCIFTAANNTDYGIELNFVSEDPTDLPDPGISSINNCEFTGSIRSIKCNNGTPRITNCLFSSSSGWEIDVYNKSCIDMSWNSNNLFSSNHLFHIKFEDSGLVNFLNGHNDFYDTGGTGLNGDFWFHNNYEETANTINCNGNYWSDRIPGEGVPYEEYIDFLYDNIPEEMIVADFGRMDDNPNCLTIGEATTRYEEAEELDYEGNASVALTLYSSILTDQLATEKMDWKNSIDRMFSLTIKLGQSLTSLISFYDSFILYIPAFVENDEREQLIRFVENYKKKAEIELKNYQNAADIVVERIDDPTSPVDSLFAVMELENIYYLASLENGRSNISTSYQQHNPQDCKQLQTWQGEHWYEIYELLGKDDQNQNIIIPVKPKLYNNYPNPFNPSTTISFSLPKESKIELSVYNIKGQKVKTLVKDEFESGKHSVIWFGKDNNKKKCSSGIYFYQLKVNGKSKSVKKCLLLK